MAERNLAELRGGKRWFFIICVLFITVSTAASAYGGNVVMPGKVQGMGAMALYPLIPVASGFGSMIALACTGALAAKYGRKAVVLTGIALHFIVRFVIMSYVNTFWVLLPLWFVNSFTNALQLPAAHSIIPEVVEPKERAKYFGFIATSAAIGTLIGPILVGWIIDLGYRDLAFMAYAPFIVPSVIGLVSIYPNQRTAASTKFDKIGLFLLIITLGSFASLLSLAGRMFPWASPITIILAVVFLVAGYTLIRFEKTKDLPAFPVQMFKRKRFRAVFITQALLVSYSTVTAGYLIVYAQQVMGISATVSGTLIMPQTIVMAVFGTIIGAFVGRNFVKRFRPVAILALVMFTAAMFTFWSLNPNSTVILIYIATVMGGIGQAVNQATFSPFFQTELSREEIGTAQSMYTFASSGGGVVFAALCGLILNAGYTIKEIFLLGIAYMGVAIIVGLFGLRFSKEDKEKMAEASS